MIGLREVELPLLSASGASVGSVRLSLLPRARIDEKPSLLVDFREVPDLDAGVAPVQVLEGKEYRFEFDLIENWGALETDRPEVFQADTMRGDSGRLRPGLHTGTIPVQVFGSGGEVGFFEIEVRSRKFDYLKHYRWMLRDLAEILSELVMERFAAAEQRFRIDDQRDAVTLYQRFALLRSLLEDEHLQGAVSQILSRPYVTWVNEEEVRPITQGARGSSQMMRQLARPGARVPWSGGPAHLTTLPQQVRSAKTYSTADNGPNRFVKFAISQWRDVVTQIHDVLEREKKPSAPIVRGIKETAALRDVLDAWLSEEFFREVGPLNHLPSNSQVLQRQAGYRAVYQTYIQFELASKLSWNADDVYGAGQRNVATLYEYWTFLQVVGIVTKLCDHNFDVSQLFNISNDGLSVVLRQGSWKVVEGTATTIGGRKMGLALHFNKTFKKGAGSWTRTMRPDVSLCIRPEDSRRKADEVWVHFDAKYRVDALKELFIEEFVEEDEEIDAAVLADDLIMGRAKGEDLLKMHAYRDAIRRSAGAYVLYPGQEAQPIQEFHEILPGLGAFPFFPTETGVAGGGHALQAFIGDILNHLSSQVTQHERGRYWRGQAYDDLGAKGVLELPPAAFLTRPAEDTLVLLGFVKSVEHLAWIGERGLYNLRADVGRDGRVGLGSRELAAEFVILYGPELVACEIWRTDGEPRILNRERMEALGYPGVRGENYFALPVERVVAGAWGGLLGYEKLKDLQAVVGDGLAYGAPVVVSWRRMVGALVE